MFRGKTIKLVGSLIIGLTFTACGGSGESEDETLQNEESFQSGIEVSIQNCESIEITAQYLNVRNNPNTDGNPIATVELGEQYVVVGTDGNWINIWFDEQTRWVYGPGYTTPKDLPCGKVINTNSLNVRAGESSSTDLVGTATQGSLWVYVDNNHDSDDSTWKNIWYKSESRYVHGSYLQENSVDEESEINIIVNSFTINSGDTSTDSVFVQLLSSVNTDVVSYQASESSTLSGATWLDYSSLVDFTLSAGNTNKQVYFRVKNAEGRLSEIVSASISLNMPSSGARQVDSTKFYDAYRIQFGSLSGSQVTGLNYLIDNFEQDTESAYTNLSVWQKQISYLLATTKHEVANTYTPITEYGSTYCANYDGGCTYKGRGYVQLTHEYNYAAMSPIVSADLVTYPERALEPDIAYTVMSYGSFNGIFTSRKLGDYIRTGSTDYYNARRVINGTDKASLIKGYAEKFQVIMEGSSI